MKFYIPFLFIAVSSVVPPIGAAELPNIVLIMSDDQGWGETSYNGHPQLKTPVLDKMAATGLRLDRFYAASPVCSPTRASVLTGRHANRMGAFGANWSIRPEEITLAPLLKAAGYRTAHYGKWHIGAVKKDSPLSPKALGFDESLSHDNFFEMNPTLSRNGNPPEQVNGEGSEILVKEALDFARRSASEDAPFFLVIWFGSPHSPYECAEKDSAPYRELGEDLSWRFGEIAAMDRAIGQFRDGLDRIGERSNTLIWFNSDNGMTTEMIPKEQQANMFNGGLRGTKSHMTEGGLRVPAIIEWPAVITKARSSSVPGVTSDILPTLLDIVQIAHPKPERPLDGISLKTLIVYGRMKQRPKPIGFSGYNWKDEQQNAPWLADQRLNEFITEIAKKKETDRKRKTYFKNHRHPVAGTEFEKTRAWIDNRYKLLFPKSKNASYELYDIVADKEESHDIALEHPEIVERMAAELKAWQLSVERSLTGADYGSRTGATGQKAAPAARRNQSKMREKAVTRGDLLEAVREASPDTIADTSATDAMQFKRLCHMRVAYHKRYAAIVQTIHDESTAIAAAKSFADLLPLKCETNHLGRMLRRYKMKPEQTVLLEETQQKIDSINQDIISATLKVRDEPFFKIFGRAFQDLNTLSRALKPVPVPEGHAQRGDGPQIVVWLPPSGKGEIDLSDEKGMLEVVVVNELTGELKRQREHISCGGKAMLPTTGSKYGTLLWLRPLAESVAAELEPVEESINIHMALLFKPSYIRLKTLMRESPKEAVGWKAIQAEALLLAESGSNLKDRRPSEVSVRDGKEYWAKNSSEVQTFGAELYHAAKEKDFAAATRSYKSMTKSCNACHQANVFLGGPPVLNPFGKGVTD